jgi:hypothetical protein
LEQYEIFRKDTISLCLRAAEIQGGYRFDHETKKELIHFKKFRKAFTGDFKQRWYDVVNGIQHNEEILKDILAQCDIFAQQVSYALNNLIIDDDNSLGVLTRVSQRPFLVKHWIASSGDPARYVGGYLFEVLAMYSFASGPLEEDFIEKAIRKL